MASAQRSTRGSGSGQEAIKRQRIAELQKLITEQRAAVQSRTRELSDARRILQAADECSRLSALIASVQDLPGDQGETLLSEHAASDRARKARLCELERQLADRRQRQLELQRRLSQVRDQVPPASQARQQLQRAVADPATQREYTAMLEQYGSVTRLYNMLEMLMVTSDYPWLESAEWMQVIRPAYHGLTPPSHLLRADMADEESGNSGDSEDASSGAVGTSEG